MKNYNICTPFPYLESEGISHDHIEEDFKKTHQKHAYKMYQTPFGVTLLKIKSHKDQNQ